MNYCLLLLALASWTCAEPSEVEELRADIRFLKNDFKILKNEMVAMKQQHHAEIQSLQRHLAGDFTFQTIFVSIWLVINGIRFYKLLF